MLGSRISKLEEFFNVKKPKELNELEWLERLYGMQLNWEEENQKDFPI